MRRDVHHAMQGAVRPKHGGGRASASNGGIAIAGDGHITVYGVPPSGERRGRVRSVWGGVWMLLWLLIFLIFQAAGLDWAAWDASIDKIFIARVLALLSTSPPDAMLLDLAVSVLLGGVLTLSIRHLVRTLRG